jgi:predicted HicB family RNase H-like nuclease
MPSKDSETVAARLPRNVVKLVREAAKDDGVSVSTWVGRRVNNTLRRTGRLQAPETRQASPE